MNDTKSCPFCGEMIKSDALKCRYCREWLNEVQEIKPVTPAAGIKKVEPVIIPVVNEVKTTIPVAVPEAPQEIIPEKIPDITSEEIVPAAKTYPAGTIVLFDGKKVKSKLKNFYKNRFLPFYQNSYLLFFILTALIYGGGNALKRTIFLAYAPRSAEFLAYYSFLSNILTVPNIIVSALILAAGMMFISMRNDKEQLQKSVKIILLPVIIAIGGITVFCLTAPEQLALMTYREELLPSSETFHQILSLGVITFAINGITNFLLMVLLARGQFGRLFLCVLTGCVVNLAVSLTVRSFMFISLCPAIELFLTLFFCRKLLFRNFRFKFDWLLVGKFVWYALCIAAALYFICIFELVSFLWCKGVEKLFLGIFPIFLPVAACLWGAYLSDRTPKFSFWLKTLLFYTVLEYLLFILLYCTDLFYGNMDSTFAAMGWADGEFAAFCMLLTALAIVKSVSNAYYCCIKWHFMLVLNVFMLLWSSLAFLEWCLPGSGTTLQLIIRESNLPTEYGWIFLLFSFVIDLFALFHAIYSCKKEIVLNKKIHIACNVAAILIILLGFVSIDRCLLNSRLHVLNMKGSGIELKQTP